MKKKLLATMLVTAMAASATACGGGASGDAGSGGGGAAGGGASITIFNSKSEIQDQFVEMAEKYSSEKGVNVEVYFSNDTVAAHLATRYSSNDPYTLSMVDAKDIYSLGPEHAIDLSDQEWVKNTNYAISVDNKVMGFPVCIEARGVMYNAEAIEAIIGKEFVPADYATLKAFTGLLDELVKGGMEKPVGIMKEDWSLAAHFLAEVYEEQTDIEGFITKLHEGTADLANNEKFNAKMDYFDVMKKYNYKSDSPATAERDLSEQMLAEGKIAFMFGGNWDWSQMKDFDPSEKMGMMPVPSDLTDGSNAKMEGGGSKFFFIDSSENTSEEQRQAAKDFLNWLVLDAEGNKFLTENCNLVPAYSNISAEALDPLSASVKEFADAGNLIPNYNYLPDDHYSACGASMQKYLDGKLDRAGLAAEIETYWKAAAPVAH